MRRAALRASRSGGGRPSSSFATALAHALETSLSAGTGTIATQERFGTGTVAGDAVTVWWSDAQCWAQPPPES